MPKFLSTWFVHDPIHKIGKGIKMSKNDSHGLWMTRESDSKYIDCSFKLNEAYYGRPPNSYIKGLIRGHIY